MATKRKLDRNKHYIMVRLSAEQFGKINGAAEARGLYVAEMVRGWIDSIPVPDQEGAA
jgi:hypothetical protein